MKQQSQAYSAIPSSLLRVCDMAVVSVGKHGVAATVLGVLFLAVVATHRYVVAGAVAAAVHHHVVGLGGDPWWDVASDVPAWPADRLFTVGDTLWFAYSAADGRVAEVGGEVEFESCEVGNPIGMYTEGLSTVGLDDEGSRYFVSADPARCRSGLKLRVDVRAPVSGTSSPRVEDRAAAPAPAPAPEPSASRGIRGVASLMCVLLSLVCVWCFLFLGI